MSKETPSRSHRISIDTRGVMAGDKGRSATEVETSPSGIAAAEGRAVEPTHERHVFADPVAFRYLEEDPATTVLERNRELKGYELYLVEQWACSRKDPTFVIVTYTGDSSHSVLVSVLNIPTDQEAWSPRLRLYFAAASKYKARRKETPLGTLMVTNLSWFPSALTVVLVPDGNIKKHREDFIVNEDLKRLGCAGRAGLSLSAPSDATRTKFYQLYKISDQVPLYAAVIELVKLCQVALMLFNRLDSSYADGLLCDVTEHAINSWWTEMGTDFFNFEPHDGILGPTTVAALIGMLTGARNRLHVYGAPVTKDPFDLDNLKNGIASFQKSQKLPQTRRLDPQTMEKLHRATAKAASGEGWTVPRAVKSTMAELSGKGGEMVMGMVGGRDKASIADVETLDFERFVELVRGDRCKWLWHGKPRRPVDREPDRFSGPDHEATAKAVGRRTPRDSFDVASAKAGSDREAVDQADVTPDSPIDGTGNDALGDKNSQLRRTVLRNVASKKNDARSGLGKIKDAVGLSAIRGRHQKEDVPSTERGNSPVRTSEVDTVISGQGLKQPPGSLGAVADLEPERPDKPTPIRTTMEAFRREREAEEARLGSAHVKSGSGSPSTPTISLTSPPQALEGVVRKGSEDITADEESNIRSARVNDGNADFKIAKLRLRRNMSSSELVDGRHERRNGNRWPRHLSFGCAEDAILLWQDILRPYGELDGPSESLFESYASENCLAEKDKRHYTHLLDIEGQLASWVQHSLEDVEALDREATHDREQLNTSYALCAKDYQNTMSRLNRLLPEQKASLMEAVRDVNVLSAKLDYELNNLVAKVEDVEDGVEGIERHVYSLELKAQEFAEDEKTRESWWWWLIRIVAGIGR